MTRSYGVLYGSVGKVEDPEFKDLIPKRAFFLVDQQGIIRQQWLVEGGEDVIFPSESLLKGIQEMAGKP